MKTRTIGEAIQVLNETALPKSFTDSEVCKSLQSATLTLAAHPSEHSYKHFQRRLWMTYGWLESKIEVGWCCARSEGQIRILLTRLESFFA